MSEQDKPALFTPPPSKESEPPREYPATLDTAKLRHWLGAKPSWCLNTVDGVPPSPESVENLKGLAHQLLAKIDALRDAITRIDEAACRDAWCQECALEHVRPAIDAARTGSKP